MDTLSRPDTSPEPSARRSPRGKAVAAVVVVGVVVLLAVGAVAFRATRATAFETAYQGCYERLAAKSESTPAEYKRSVASFATLGDGGDSLILDGAAQPEFDLGLYGDTPTTPSDEELRQFIESLGFTNCVLEEVNTPDYVQSKLENTTSLMGDQTATWDNISASWSFHPDNGLDVTLHLI